MSKVRLKQNLNMKLITVVTLITTVLIATLLMYSWKTYNSYRQLVQRDIEIIRLSGSITHLDEVLTMSARMAAATGDPAWSVRYRNAEPELDKAIKNAIKLAPASFGDAFSSTDKANIALVEAESKCLDLVAENKYEEAQQLVFSEEYETLKKEYHSGLEKALDQFDKNMQFNIDNERKWTYTAVIFAILSITATLVAFFLGMKQAKQDRIIQDELATLTRRYTIERLAGSLAHELNQPLAAIAYYSDAAKATLKDNQSKESVAQSLTGITEQATRAGEIIQRIRDFIGSNKPRQDLVDLGDVLRDTEKLVQPLAKDSGTEIQFDKPGMSAKVRGDILQLEQVFVNLVVNAIEACIDQPFPRTVLVSYSQAEDWNHIRVIDSGKKIDNETRERIFDAFYTSRTQGLGLGLSISRDIVESHGGTIQLEKVQDRTCFRVDLPRVKV